MCKPIETPTWEEKEAHNVATCPLSPSQQATGTLVVDEDGTIRTLHSAAPSIQGHTVEMAMHPEDAIDRIEIHDDVQVADWSRVFGVGADVLREAIKSIGPSARNIHQWLAKTAMVPQSRAASTIKR